MLVLLVAAVAPAFSIRVGPWFVPSCTAASGFAQLRYVVLLP
jgi:hypothetical protein